MKRKGRLEIIEAFRKEFQNTGKLELAFNSLKKHGIVTLHYAGYTQADGFADCNEVAAWLDKNEKRLL